ncbi:hypothetical protein D3OALGA1CA_892 [Olavius algarvensis associated proteobacterium Delta 3]|nr:hypothetical protein D3OALGA1CA_892 [Olavius algarvensis associated proteobacterium Delta 3]CAB5143801.1 hypothetical protein D3OALGB2SA_4395 [Olavius algarvensis associated proteobacterium Delta 3]
MAPKDDGRADAGAPGNRAGGNGLKWFRSLASKLHNTFAELWI